MFIRKYVCELYHSNLFDMSTEVCGVPNEVALENRFQRNYKGK